MVHLPILEGFTGLSEDHFLLQLMQKEVPLKLQRKVILGDRLRVLSRQQRALSDDEVSSEKWADRRLLQVKI